MAERFVLFAPSQALFWMIPTHGHALLVHGAGSDPAGLSREMTITKYDRRLKSWSFASCEQLHIVAIRTTPWTLQSNIQARLSVVRRSFQLQIEPIPRLFDHGDASDPVGPGPGCGILPGEGHALQGSVFVDSQMRRVCPVADACQGVLWRLHFVFTALKPARGHRQAIWNRR